MSAQDMIQMVRGAVEAGIVDGRFTLRDESQDLDQIQPTTYWEHVVDGNCVTTYVVDVPIILADGEETTFKFTFSESGWGDETPVRSL